MLTYSLSLSGATILPLRKIVSAELAKYFWNEPFTLEELDTLLEDDTTINMEIQLANYRDKIITISNAFTEKNNWPLSLKTILKESIFSIYSAYRQMLIWIPKYDPENRYGLLEEGELYGPNYFNADGVFNDFVWVKRFAVNKNHRIVCRFHLSCCYWLENETAALWREINNSNLPPLGCNLDEFPEEMNPMITLRVFELENKLHILAQDSRFRGNFWEVGFQKAAENGCDYAVYFFWSKMNEQEKLRITESDNFFEFIGNIIVDNLGYFLYSQLSEERKNNFFGWTIEHFRPEKWFSLLLSCAEAARSEIIEQISQLPSEMHLYLLEWLARRIKEIKRPVDIELFLTLWGDTSPDEKQTILRDGRVLIRYLVMAKSLKILGHIIKGLSPKEKEQCLLYEIYEAGIGCLDILSKAGEFDMLQEYLSFFLIEKDPVTQKEILRKDASLFLQKFIDAPNFKLWCKGLFEAEEEVSGRIEALQASIVLTETCEKELKNRHGMIPNKCHKTGPKVIQELDLNFSSSNRKRNCEEQTESTKVKKMFFIRVL